MPLDTQNLETLLKEQIQTYMNGTITYEALRSDCLTVSPVQPVLNALSIILDR